MGPIPNTTDLQAENQALQAQLLERGQQLYETLNALAGMWNQYCPPPFTHQTMTAGENAEVVLQAWQLLRSDQTAIDFYDLGPDEEIPPLVKSLLVKQ
ncbi:hypothetical protein [Hymenobacter norwichensis]|uniref:hypothetical protein n=1 Tax=Hymenobacter norwichensis TaxID=223903 RepID=UPI0003B447D6|nr:hypothetical protein [Hymenobacter norwichensis]